MERIIEARELTKRYGRIEALRNLNLSVSEGICALVGPNGAGKTTLIKICAGKLKPDSGHCRILGLDDPLAIRKEIGILHDKVSLPPEVTVEFFLEKVGEIYHIDGVHVNETIRLCGLEDVRTRQIGTLSLGYGKRLGIAQAVVHKPRLVIADEPFSQLDPMTRMKIKDLMIELWKDHGMSFMISSHDISDIEQVAHQFVIMDRGQVVKDLNSLGTEDVIIRAQDREGLLTYLIENGHNVAVNGPYVVMSDVSVRDVLGILSRYDGAIHEVKGSSLESILKDVFGQ